MLAAVLVLSAAAAVLAGLLLPPWLRRRRRAAVQARALPDHWRAIADRHVPLRERLPPALLARHDGLIQAFLAEKEFAGCNGLVATDEVRATIAAQACLLVLGRPGSLYDELHSILVYPTQFWVEDEVHDDDGLVTRRRRALSGEAWDSSRIILSWEDVLASGAFEGDGYNVVLHEFAHYLQSEGGGLPAPLPPAPLPQQRERSRAARVRATRVRALEDWESDLQSEFEALVDAVDRGEETFLDPYAAEDADEFFAVAAEDFFERPVELRAAHARLYGLLGEFFAVDPAAWFNPD